MPRAADEGLIRRTPEDFAGARDDFVRRMEEREAIPVDERAREKPKGEGAYRVVDLRGVIPGSPRANQGARAKEHGVIIHYNGPATGVPSGGISPEALYAQDARYHMALDWGGGARANGIQYHYGVWGDTVYILRDPASILWHCGSWPENATCYAVNVPIGEGERATETTLATLAALTADLLARQGLSREHVWGHREVSPTACPGSLMADFVYPYRSGALRPGFLSGWRDAKYTFVSGSVEWGEGRCRDAVSRINALAEKRLARWTGRSDRARYASQLAYESQPVGRRVVVAVGARAEGKLSEDARGVLGRYPMSQSDIWDGTTERRLRECIAEIERRERLGGGLLSFWDERYPTPRRKRPRGGDAAGAIDAYFAENYEYLGPYEPAGELIVREAERAGLALEAACALVEQESGGRNVFGCDHGPTGDRPPYCRQPVTRERVRRLIDSPYMNGVGLTQLTWWEFVLEAERLGGAHLPEHQLRVGFGLLAGYFAKYGEPDGWGAYNAGEASRASVRSTYSAQCMAKRDAWRRRLQGKRR